MICLKCGKHFKDGTKFCSICGMALAEDPVNNVNLCKKCKTELKAEHLFCPKCGWDQNKEYIDTHNDEVKKSINNHEQEDIPSNKKKKNSLLPVIIVALVIVIIGVGGYLSTKLLHNNSSDDSPQAMTDASNSDDSSASASTDDSSTSTLTDDSSTSTDDSTENKMSAAEIDAKNFTYDDYVTYTDSQTGETSYYGLFKKSDIDYSKCKTSADYYTKLEEYCEDRHGHLAIINTEKENTFLYHWVSNKKNLGTALFGLSDCENESYDEEDNFVWVDGSKGYTNWQQDVNETCEKQPNNRSGHSKEDRDEDFVIFSTNPDAAPGSWMDVRFDDISEHANYTVWKDFICEWDDEVN